MFKRDATDESGEKLRKKVKLLITVALLAVLVCLIVYNGMYNIKEQQQGVVTMFGKVIRTDTAGLHFKLPLIQRVHKVDMTTHGTGIGYTVSPEGQNIANTSDGIMITSDFNLINIDFYLEYRVSDPVAYLYHSKEPEAILKNIALSSIRSTVVNFTVDEAMTTGKSAIQADVKAKMVEELAEQDIGLQVVNITIQDAEPPTAEIIQAFKSVETAKQGAETKINQARKYQSEQIPAADATADRIIQSAEAQKAARIAEAEGQVARFAKMYEEYANNPEITRQRLYYEVLEKVLPGIKMYVTDGSTQAMLPLEPFDSATEAQEVSD